MSKIKSLQYLLLDHLFKIKNKSNEIHVDKIAKSLIVEDGVEDYIIKWKNNIENYKIQVKKDNFNFYERNDIKSLKKDEDFLKKNNLNAESIISKYFLKVSTKKNKAILIKRYFIHLAYFLSMYLLIDLFLTKKLQYREIILITLLFLDLLPPKIRIAFSFIILFISFLDPGNIYIFYSIFLLFFTIFDTNQFFKKIKIIILCLIIFYYFHIINYEITLEFSIHFFIICFLIMIASIVNFIKYNSNYSWIYCFPSFALAKLASEEIMASYLIMLICIFFIPVVNYLDNIFFFRTNTSRRFE
jgi:hypothetical protein